MDPGQLLRAAAELGIVALAITDHDTVSGYLHARDTEVSGCELIAGVELSCCWSNATIHIVGLKIDVNSDILTSGLKQLNQARLDRAGKISERLGKHKFEGTLAGALEIAGDSQIGRPHFARYLVNQGYVSSEKKAFDKYLGAGKCGDVKAYWPTMAQAVEWIVESGGIAVLAHPRKYRLTRTKLRRLLVDFREVGGTGIEVISGVQTQQDTAMMARLSVEFSLLASVGSDFHAPRPYGAELGSRMELPSICQPVWADW